MLTDNALLFATNEAPPNQGADPGGLGGNTITGVADSAHYIDLGSESAGQIGYAQLSSTELELRIQIDTSFGVTNPTGTIEFALVSMPILPSLLSGGLTSGKLTGILSVTVVVGTPGVITLTGHGLALGTPFFFLSGSGGSGTATNTIYYAIPLTANTFAFATSFANALAGTGVAQSSANFASAVIQFLPQTHVTTGPLRTVFLNAGVQISANSVTGYMSGQGKILAPYSGATPKPAGMAQHIVNNVGASAAPFVPSVGRYLCLHVYAKTVSAGTTGRYSAQLGMSTGSGERNYRSGFIAQ